MDSDPGDRQIKHEEILNRINLLRCEIQKLEDLGEVIDVGNKPYDNPDEPEKASKPSLAVFLNEIPDTISSLTTMISDARTRINSLIF